MSRKITTDIFITEAKEVHEDLHNKYLSYAPSPLPEKSLEYLYPEVSKDWDYERNHPLTPKNFTRGSGYKAWWKCSKGHEWKTSIAHRTHKEKPTGCYKCYLEERKFYNQDNTKSFIKKAKNVHGNKYDYSEAEYKN